MKTITVLTSLFFLTACSYKPQFSKAFDYGVVYGNDNRSGTDFHELSNSNPELSDDQVEMLLEMATATAGMVEIGTQIKKNNDGNFSPFKELLTLGERKNLCKGEKFEDEFTLPICTGFLIGPDLLATAGHCLDKENYKNKVWIFGYNSDFAFNINPLFNKDNVYFTKEVVLWEKNSGTNKDFAVVRLNKKVSGVKSLIIRTYGKINNGDKLAIIGHPTGLTTKISAGAEVLDVSETNRIKTNLDSFVGNSGSPVINLETGKVEGILVNGANDFINNDSLERDTSCQKVNSRGESEGEEYITRISLISSAISH